MFKYFIYWTATLLCFISSSLARDYSVQSTAPDKIFFNGKIVTVDKDFTIAQAVAVKRDRFLAVGSNKQILKLAGYDTERIDLRGRTVIPGMIDAHSHFDKAATSELAGEIAVVRTVQEILDWVAESAAKKPDGEWIIHPKLFSTRVREMRYPTKEQLDAVAPDNPVFLNGSYGGMVNSCALRISGLTKDTEHKGVLKDPVTGELTGYLRRSALRLLKGRPSYKWSYEQKLDAIEKMIKMYNSVGLTGVGVRSIGPTTIRTFQDLYNQGRLNIRVFLTVHIRTLGLNGTESIEQIRKKVGELGYYTGFGNEWIRIGQLKAHMDGGILTGTAYLRQPWAQTYPERVREVYSITDPEYRGILLMTAKQLAPLAKMAAELGWSFTCHCTGGGGVDVMLEAFEEVNKTMPIKDKRFSIIHGNFYTPEAIEKMSRLGVTADLQPAWFYRDGDAMRYVLGEKRIKTFHPYRQMFDAGVLVSAGSDHMVKLDSYTSENPYNPFIVMWSMITRKTERGTVICPEEAITRQEALQMYTINNAYASFEEKIKGSIEAGKLADMVVLAEDILTCPVDRIKDMKVEKTIVGGKVVYKR